MTTLTEEHRQAQLLVRTQTLRQLVALWPALDWTRLDATYPAWAVAAAQVIQTNRATSAGLASLYLRTFRADAGIPGQVVIVNAGAADPAVLATSLRVTSVIAAKKAAAAGFSVKDAMANSFVQSSGAATRLVLEGGRDTLVQSLRADPRKPGWQRVTSGRACAFCSMLADRGAVYGEDSGDFEAHDHCGCSVEPVYRN